MKLGSLFDGSGGFPLAGSICGIEPVWAAEVEPYPIAVTTSRFPKMRHLGSVTDIDGAKVEPVDIITFGSPCQDLSVAGKRAGLKHEANGGEETTRSGLFMEAVRIIREMREATNGRYPAFALWENVPGAFSSNKGEDFRTVLEELVKIVEPSAVMPPVPKNGWPYADCYMGDGWSLAYRVFDAQYWGVPQRRRRIYLVLHLTGQCAGQVLFEREGLRRHLEESGTPWETVAGDAENCVGAADREGAHCVAYSFDSLASNSMKSKNPHSGCRQVEVAKTLDTTDPNPCKNQGGIAVVEQYLFENHSQDTRYRCPLDICPMLPAQLGTGGNNTQFVVEKDVPVYCLQGNGIDRADTAECNGKGWKEDTCYTLNTIDRPAVVSQTYQKVTGPLMANSHPGSYTGQDAFSDMLVAGGEPAIYATFQNTGQGWWNETPVGATVRTPCGGDSVLANVCVEVHGMDCRNGELNGDLCGTLQAKPNGGFSYNCIHPVIVKTPVHYIVRRLTPTECARLQGFPDEWGHPVPMEEITDGDYRFWLEVRKRHAAINGKTVKDFTEEQIMNWYNKLHTDSSEYKMWGNGIALPCALYVMEGIAEASGTDICAIEDRRNALEFCPICGGSNGLHEFTTENGRNWGCSVCGWEDAT